MTTRQSRHGKRVLPNRQYQARGLEAHDLIAQIAIGQQLESLDYRMLNRMGTVNSKVSPGIFGGGGGNGCARRTVSIVS